MRTLLAVLLVSTSAAASVSTPFRSEGRITIGPGTVYDHGTFVTTTAGIQAAYFVEVNPHDPLLSFEASLSNDRVAGLETTTSQANRKNGEGHRAVAAANADFWGPREAPSGMHIELGELISDGGSPRPTLGVKPAGELMIALADVNTLVKRSDGVSMTAREVNESRSSGDFVLYTSRFGSTTGTDANGTEVVLTGVTLPLRAAGTYTGTVSQLHINAGDTPIGANEVVLSGSGNSAAFLSAMAVGQSVTFTTSITAGWANVVHAVGGGHFILRNGAIDINPDTPGFADVTHPRTALGLTASGNLVMAVVDGRQPGYSIGVRLDELAELMLSRGAVTAINMDGGGSSTLAVRLPGDDGVVQVNRGSDGFERSVSNSLVLFSGAPTGLLAIANVVPSNASFFLGSGASYLVKGQDAAYNKVAIDSSRVTWSLSNPGVGSIGTSGLFTSNSKGATEVRGTIGSVTGSTTAKVTDTLFSLEISPNPAIVAPNAQQLFSLVGRDAEGNAVIVGNNVATWSATGSIGTISSSGLLTATALGTGSVRASADGVSATATVDIGRPPEMIEDYEDVSDMRANAARATATFTFAMRPNPVRHGTRSGWLTYNFTNQPAGTSAAYAEHNPVRPITGRPLRVGVWVYGDGSRHWLRGNYRDGANTQKNLDFTAAPSPVPVVKADCKTRNNGINWIGWKYLEATIPADAVLPLKWERIYVVETVDLCDDVSALFFDDMRAVYSNTSEDLIGPEVRDLVPAPGKRVFTSRPEIGGTVVDDANGSGVAPESIRLTVDEKQVAALFDVTADLVRYTPATPLADGAHKARLEAEDRAGNPSLPFGDWSFVVYTGPDLDAPVIDRAQPMDGTTSPFGRPRISARIQDEYRGVDAARIVLTVDGSIVPATWDSAAGVVWYAPAAPFANGTHTVNLRAGDRETPSNLAASSWSFTVNALAAPPGAFTFTWLADGGYFDGTKETAPSAILLEHLAREKASPPHLLIFGGDIVENDQQANYDRARAALATVGAPVLVAAGNHEISGSLSRDRFWRTFGPTIAALDYGPVDFLFVDSASSSFSWDTSQYGWLQSELARSPARTLFLVQHVPTRDPFASSHGVPAAEGAKVEAILAAAKAARPSRDIFVLSGDSHAYGRWQQDGVHYVISGGAGGSPHAIPGGGGFYHRLHIAIDANGVATINVIPLLKSIAVVPDSLSLREGGAGRLSATGNFFTASAPGISMPLADSFERSWSSSDSSVAEVSDGVVKARAPGEATITLISGGVTSTASVTVKPGRKPARSGRLSER